MLGLDSRPPNWQFPQRLGDCGGVEVRLPPRGGLGILAAGADRAGLREWLGSTCQGQEAADGVVLSLDALLYGGLVQSRRLEVQPELDALKAALGGIDWHRIRGYAYITLPRLGISVDSAALAGRHELVREYFVTYARAQGGGGTASTRRERLSAELGPELIEQLWALRRRNLEVATECHSLCAALGFQALHVAVEDNAPAGPHIAEAASLRQLGRVLRSGGARTEFSLFDGADECACLLLARAAADLQDAGPLPLRVAVHPAAPGPQNYRGLYETHTLAEGLDFLLAFLRLESRSEAGALWLVCHGLQPQPDAFVSDPERAFASPFLIPERLRGFDPARQALFVSDLCACNGANPHLAEALLKLAGPALKGLIGFNTNFNALGVTAALLSLWLRGPRNAGCHAALRQFLIERLADDVVYQSLVRQNLVAALCERGMDPMNFAAAGDSAAELARQVSTEAWRDWQRSSESALHDVGLGPLPAVSYSFPWQRSFECEVEGRPEGCGLSQTEAPISTTA